MVTTQQAGAVVLAMDVLEQARSIGLHAYLKLYADYERQTADGLEGHEWAECVSTYGKNGLTDYLRDECGYEGEPEVQPSVPTETATAVPYTDAGTARAAARKLGDLKAAHRTFAKLAAGVADTVGALAHVKGAATHANTLIKLADKVAADTTKVHKAESGLKKAALKFDARGGDGERLAAKADKGTTTFVLTYGDNERDMVPADGRAVWSLLSGAPYDQNIDAAVTGRLLKRLPGGVTGRVKVLKVRESDGAEYTKQFVVHRGDTSVIIRVENPSKEDKDAQMLSSDEYTLKLA